MTVYTLKSSCLINISKIKGAVITRPVILMLFYSNKDEIL